MKMSEQREPGQAGQEGRGVQLDGMEPKALVLEDGTRLTLEAHSDGEAAIEWNIAGAEAGDAGISVGEALQIAGDEHAQYVKVRTRAEAAWLRMVSEWFDEQARRLEGDLARSAA